MFVCVCLFRRISLTVKPKWHFIYSESSYNSTILWLYTVFTFASTFSKNTIKLAPMEIYVFIILNKLSNIQCHMYALLILYYFANVFNNFGGE